MLLSVILGNHIDMPNEWNVSTDQYDNTFLVHEGIGQRIRLGNRVKNKLQPVYTTDNASAYNIAEHTFFSNNNKNMNMTLMNFWNKDPDVIYAHEDDTVMYVTMQSDSHRLISYNSRGHEIIQTYRKKERCQGCVVSFKQSALEFGENNKAMIFQMFTKDFELKCFVDIRIYVNSDMEILIEKEAVTDTNVVKDLKSAYIKLGARIEHFKMLVHEGKLLTSTYIVAPEYADMAEDMVQNIGNADIMSISRDAFSENAPYSEKKQLKEFLTEHIINNHVRAITCIGIRLPYEFCKEYNILYLFSYDVREKRLNCIKSN